MTRIYTSTKADARYIHDKGDKEGDDMRVSAGSLATAGFREVP